MKHSTQDRIAKIIDYQKVVGELLPLVQKAWACSIKADIDNGKDRKTWRMIYADVATIYGMIKDLGVEEGEEEDDLSEW